MVGVVQRLDAVRDLLVRELDLAPAQRGQHAGHDHREAVGASVHDTGFAQCAQLFGPALDSLIGRLEGPRQDIR